MLLLPIRAMSQFVEGTVLDRQDNEPVRFATVSNKRTGQVVYSDNDGKFKMNASFGDTIFISHPGYIFSHKVVTASSNQWIYIHRKKYQLEEVEILSDMARFKKDSADRSIIYRKTIKDAHHTPSMGLNNGIVMEGLFSSLALWISGKGKKNKKFVRTMVMHENAKFIALKYNPLIVHEQTGLSEDSAMQFMMEYPMPYDYARTASDLEIKMWIRTNFREWIQNPANTDSIKINTGMPRR